jgi:hypothetical protein
MWGALERKPQDQRKACENRDQDIESIPDRYLEANNDYRDKSEDALGQNGKIEGHLNLYETDQ